MTILDSAARAATVPPAFEFLFGGIGKIFKTVTGKAVSLAKRGLKAVANIALGPLLRRLKPIAIALLKKALKIGLKWIPAELRPAAERLSRRLPFLRETDDTAGDATGDVRDLQEEFDLQVADTVFADTEAVMERETAAYVREPELAPDPVEELGRCRERFISQLTEAEDGANVTPEIEAFLPAMLPILRLAMRATGGRSALVKILSGMLHGLLAKFIGKNAARPMSRALVEAGLKFIQLEITPADEQRAVATAAATIVEDTMRKVAELPDHVLSDDALLEGYLLEAFEQAAARSLPHVLTEETYLQRPELRQDRSLCGVWMPLPLHGVKRYRKHTCMPWVTVSPYQAAHIRSFRGLPLSSVLYQRFGRPPGAGMRTRVHLFEAIPGTSVADIALGERGVPRIDTAQLHPLTPEAAGLLLGEPALGEDTDPRYLASNRLLGVGQRLYYLEVADAPAQQPTLPSRPTEATVTLGFLDDTVVTKLFLSEADAQAVATALRRGLSAGRVLAPLVPRLRQRIGAALDCHRLRVVHSAIPPRWAATALRRVPPATIARLAQEVEQGLTRSLAELMKEQRDAFVTATESPAEGVTVRAALLSPPVLPEVRAALGAAPRTRTTRGPSQSPRVSVSAGHERP